MAAFHGTQLTLTELLTNYMRYTNDGALMSGTLTASTDSTREIRAVGCEVPVPAVHMCGWV